MEVKNIKYYKEHEKVVANWLYSEWGEKGSLQYWKDWVTYTQDESSCFQTFVVVENNKPLATYGIMPCDLQSRQDLFPWIGNLFVPKENRKRTIEIISQIFKHSETVFKQLSLNKIYVFTPHPPVVFKRYGYKFIGFSTDYNGEKISLLEKNIK